MSRHRNDPPKLSVREALLLRELMRAGGGILSTYTLAEAIGDDTTDPWHAQRVAMTVRRIRQKFGANTIETGPGSSRGKGYRIGRTS